MEYKFNDHLHNYAVWTAARAVQRNFTNTKNIKVAIEQTSLRDCALNCSISTEKEFDNFHRETARELIEYFKDQHVYASYGHAAKIIAIYLKTAVIIRDSGKGTLSKIAHPPIDNILLRNLSRQYPDFFLQYVKWTYLNEEEYFKLINKLRTIRNDYFWELEKFWSPTQK